MHPGQAGGGTGFWRCRTLRNCHAERLHRRFLQHSQGRVLAAASNFYSAHLESFARQEQAMQDRHL